MNTLALHGDLDDVEILEDIEATFGIKLSDRDAEMLLTIGDLKEMVREKLKERKDFDAIWALLEYVARIHSGSRSDIDRDTTFFTKDAKPRTK